jgi:hypothetical protein
MRSAGTRSRRSKYAANSGEWIDQAEDYWLRGDRTRTEEALREVFGGN